MKREPQDPRPDDPTESSSRPTDPAREPAAGEALLRWDELDEELLGMLAEDPRTGQRLRKLQDADAWLRTRAREAAARRGGPELLVCPPAEELFDFGQGPGANLLSPTRRAAIDRHLATCAECESFVGTLGSRPPSPLVIGALPEHASAADKAALTQKILARPVVPGTTARAADAPLWPAANAKTEAQDAGTATGRVLPLRRSAARGMLAPVAAAAAVLVAVVVIDQSARSRNSFPEPVVLRGADSGYVLFPRGRVLAASASVRELFPALAATPTFELEPQPEANAYRFELERTSGGAFGASTPVGAPLRNVSPIVSARGPLDEGDYALKAWAEVRGLERPLGNRGFQVRRDPDLETRLLKLRSLRGLERTMAAITLLDENGYVSDARALASTLPPSAERDAYLARPRGR